MAKRHGGSKWFRSRGQSLNDRNFSIKQMDILTRGCVGKAAGAMRNGWLTAFIGGKPKPLKGGSK